MRQQPADEQILSTEDLALLRHIYDEKHPTTQQLLDAYYPGVSRGSLNHRLRKLIGAKLLVPKLLYPHAGQRSERYFRLTQKGARAIGLEQLGKHHYRTERYETFFARSVAKQLAHLARRHGFRLSTSNADAYAMLREYLYETGRRQTGRDFPIHTISNLVPRTIQPDLVMHTGMEAILVIIAAHHAGISFWKRRLQKYDTLLHRVHGIGIVLSELQRDQCTEALRKAGLDRRVLLLMHDELHVIAERLSPSSPSS